MSFIGLDMSKNISLFTVPWAFALAHGPHMYAVICGGKLYDNENPRNFRDAVTSSQAVDSARKQRIMRAKAAADNGLETLGFYAAAVVAANFAGLETRTLNQLSLTYAASRLVYVAVYIWLQSNRGMALLRTVAWGTSVITTLTLWIKAGMKLMEN